MSWAKYAIESLREGKVTQVRPRGNSMKGRVNDGDLVTLEACGPDILKIGDVVLVKVRGKDYLHLIKAVKVVTDGVQYLIGNNRGGVNGWVGPHAIYGVVTKIES